MIRYRIYPEHRLVSLHLEGEVGYHELVAWHFELARHPDYRKEFDGIANQRYATMQLEPEDMARIVQLNEEHQFVTGRWVHLIDTPMETALAMLYKGNPELHHEMNHFVSDEAASNFLGYDIAPYRFRPEETAQWIVAGRDDAEQE